MVRAEEGMPGKARLVICQGHVCTAAWVAGGLLDPSHTAHGDLCPCYCNWHCLEVSEGQKTHRVSSSCPTILGSALHCLPRAIGTPHLPAPDMAQLYTSNPLAVMHHLLLRLLLLLLLTPCFSSVLLLFFSICRE